MNRREFLTGAGSLAAFAVVPARVLAGAGRTPPSERVHVGVVGAGGQGIVNARQLMQFADVRVVAVADPSEWSDYSKFYFKGTAGREPARQIVDEHYGKQNPAGQFKGCTAYVDFREMLEREDLDACLVATTDNWHAPASMAALRKGKHVYCEKPLAKTVHEAQTLAEGAKKYGRATQTGNQGQASENHRLTCEALWEGAIGDKGKMLDGRLIPEARMKEYKLPPKTLPRSPGHHREWIDACKGLGVTGASFDITGPMTEVLAMGNLALRFPGMLLRWDTASRSFSNCPEANKFLHRPYRNGYIL